MPFIKDWRLYMKIHSSNGFKGVVECGHISGRGVQVDAYKQIISDGERVLRGLLAETYLYCLANPKLFYGCGLSYIYYNCLTENLTEEEKQLVRIRAFDFKAVTLEDISTPEAIHNTAEYLITDFSIVQRYSDYRVDERRVVWLEIEDTLTSVHCINLYERQTVMLHNLRYRNEEGTDLERGAHNNAWLFRGMLYLSLIDGIYEVDLNVYKATYLSETSVRQNTKAKVLGVGGYIEVLSDGTLTRLEQTNAGDVIIPPEVKTVNDHIFDMTSRTRLIRILPTLERMSEKFFTEDWSEFRTPCFEVEIDIQNSDFKVVNNTVVSVEKKYRELCQRTIEFKPFYTLNKKSMVILLTVLLSNISVEDVKHRVGFRDKRSGRLQSLKSSPDTPKVVTLDLVKSILRFNGSLYLDKITSLETVNTRQKVKNYERAVFKQISIVRSLNQLTLELATKSECKIIREYLDKELKSIHNNLVKVRKNNKVTTHKGH